MHSIGNRGATGATGADGAIGVTGATGATAVLVISFCVGILAILGGSFLGGKVLSLKECRLSWVSGVLFLILAFSRIL